MDREQQLAQLREYEQSVSPQLANAQSYATKSFLNTLNSLIATGLEAQDDGTDAYKEELKVIKDAIRAFSTVLPFVFKTVCQNEAESQLWEIAQSLWTITETQLMHHSNTGVCISALKCMQVIVILFSKSNQKDISINMLRAGHRLLDLQTLEKKGQDALNLVISLLESDRESILTATINCLVVIVKKRQQYLKTVIGLFTHWKKSKSTDCSPVMLRNVEKTLKLAFVALIRTEALSAHRSEMISAFGSIGGNVAMFHSRRSEESRRMKRAQQQQHENEREKRVRTEYVPTIPSGPPSLLANYDITQIPLDKVVSLCMTVLQMVPLEVMAERVAMLPSEGVTLAVTRNGFVRSTTPPYPPPPDQPRRLQHPRIQREQEIIKQEKLEDRTSMDRDSDDEMEYTPVPSVPEHIKEEIESERKEQKPKTEVLASAEERASQALKMQPYELTSSNTMTDADKRLLLKMSIERILEAGAAFEANLYAHDGSTRKAITDGNTTAAVTAPSRRVWHLLVAKLMTCGVDHAELPQNDEININKDETKSFTTTDDTDSTFELKTLLLDFIVRDLAARLDLALEWLHAEYLLDKRNARQNMAYTPSYFRWLHALLEKGIPTLDAKDRILTKLLLDAPELDDRVIELVRHNLENVPERFVSCVSTLRSLVTNRPPIRFSALQVLLDLCTNPNDKMRRTSIVAVKKWNTNQNDINDRVESFAVEALHTLSNDSVMTDETGWTEKDVVRHAELYFVLCTKKPSLLKQLFLLYVEASEQVQEHIRSHMMNMIKSIGMRSQDLVRLIKEFPAGSESLVIRILSILCESKSPTREIVAAVKAIVPLAEERSIDMSSITPILSGQSLSQETS
ncbi:hypothetical protein BD560DRAFT_392035 [Blakeslea trispora]|nr:hypothetical protein BD560DRAFT_392035 [Blakeslea trispora]